MSSQQATRAKETQIHPLASVESGAELGTGVVVRAGAYVGPHVKIGAGTVVHPQAYVDGHTTIGEDCQISPFASVGSPPQDLKYKGEPTRLEIGDRTLIRECTTLNTGTVQGGGVTKVGSDTLIMAYVHLAHDCVVGDHCVLSNGTNFAGHVTLGNWVIAGGMVGIHQFVRVGDHAFLGAGCLIGQDIPPFVTVAGVGRTSYLYGLNTIGLGRRGFSPELISTLKKVYRETFRTGRGPAEAADYIEKTFADCPEALQFAAFLRGSERGVLPDSSKRKKRLAGTDDEE